MPKPRVPPYPRPVPFIDPEEAPVLSDTIVYERWSDEVEQEAAKRASKRRKRIQDCAYAYLRDEPVLILSAGLKGPLERGWKNPWHKKKRDDDEAKVADRAWEVPETTTRAAKAYSGGRQRQEQRLMGHEDQRAILFGDARERDLPKQKQLEPSVDILNPPNRPTSNIGGQSPTSVKRVEDWLKRNEVFTERLDREVDTLHAQSSPTPRTRPGSGSGQRPNHDRSAAGQRQTGHGQTSRERKSERPMSFGQSFNDLQSSAPTYDSPGRAEAAIIEHKRRSVHKVPPSTNLDAFEYRRGRKQSKEDSKHGRTEDEPVSENAAVPLVADNDRARALQHESVGGNISYKTISRPQTKGDTSNKPLVSTETSKVAHTNNLPSAQPVPAPMKETNAQSTEDVLQVLTPPSREKSRRALATTLVHASFTDPSAQNQDLRAAEGTSVEEEYAIAGDTHPGMTEQTPAREPETQEMIAAIKPFDISTIKKPLRGTMQKATPGTATKVPLKSKKRASFVTDPASSLESHRSLKRSMKVTKGSAGATISHEKTKPSVIVHEEAEQEKGSSAKLQPPAPVDSLLSLSSMFGINNRSGPRSILKASMAVSSAPAPAGTGNTNSTSIKQDAQVPEAGQNTDFTLADDDKFDLDEAIDELGSYLGGTWDAEEEASRL